MLYSSITHIQTSTIFALLQFDTMHVYTVFISHKHIQNHTEAISTQVQVHSHFLPFTQAGGRDSKSLERPEWDSNPCFQISVTTQQAQSQVEDA